MRLNALTGLRGVAALVVFLAHLELLKYMPPLRHLSKFLTWHNAAVDLFFVLSGFTLAYVYIKNDSRKNLSFGKYFIARFGRIFPLYFVTLIISAYLLYHAVGRGYSSTDFYSDFVRQLFLVNSWPPLGNGTFFNFPSWSISVEMFCYIFVFPLLSVVYRGKLNNSFVVALFGFAWMFCSYFLYMKYYRADLLALGTPPNVQSMSYYVNLLRGVFGFMAGYMFYFSYLKGDLLYQYCRRYADIIYMLFLAVLGGGQFGLGTNTHMVVMIAPFICLACAGGEGVFNKILSRKFFVHMGDLSYSIYLSHFIVITLGTGFLKAHGLFRYDFKASVFFILSVYVVSLVSYRYYEKPMRYFMNSAYAYGIRKKAGRLEIVN